MQRTQCGNTHLICHLFGEWGVDGIFVYLLSQGRFLGRLLIRGVERRRPVVRREVNWLLLAFE